jgi:phosphoglucosamine mutase
MTAKLFGTDGIRGEAGTTLTPELAVKVGRAVGQVFTSQNTGHRHMALIGKDPRESGYTLETGITAGLVAQGMDVLLTGPLPTPAIAAITKSMRCDVGVMISASHNGWRDNGIKLFGPDGYKLSDAVEAQIEHLVLSDNPVQGTARMGRVERIKDVQGRYIESVKYTLPRDVSFEGLKVVLDCANGAAYKVAPDILKELGFSLSLIGVNPDGRNINDGVGSMHWQTAAARVLMEKADLGIALDGDADRVIILDEKGQVVDGDQIIALIASSLCERGRLTGGVVTTVMSNLGLERYLTNTLKVPMVRSQVGDRYVIEKMRELGYNLGGEQSGHIICSDYSTTGDGLVAALQLLAVIKKDGRKASEVCHKFTPVPQLLVNVRGIPKTAIDDKKVKDSIRVAEKTLAKRGRVLVRNSGTESMVRIMVESDCARQNGAIAESIEKSIRSVAH